MSGPDGISGSGLMPREGFVDALRSGKIQGEEARIRAASDALEGAFYQELFKAMRETVPESGLVDGGGGEDAFNVLMDQHLSEVAASRNEGGIGEALYRFFTRGGGG
jgi:flagellar protein FlgJ